MIELKFIMYDCMSEGLATLDTGGGYIPRRYEHVPLGKFQILGPLRLTVLHSEG